MSIEPVDWQNYDPETGIGDPSTPMTAALLKRHDAWMIQQATEAKTARDDAQEAAQLAAAPTDTFVAGVIETPSSQTTAALEAIFGAVAHEPASDDAAALNALLAAHAGEVVRLRSGGTYNLTETVAVPSGTTIDGRNATINIAGNFPAFTVPPGADECWFRGLRFVGTMPGDDIAVIQNQVGIKAYGDYDSVITGLRVTDCTFEGIQGTAVQMRNVHHFRVTGNTITRHGYAAIGGHSVRYGLVEGNDIVGTGQEPAYVANTYGIYLSTLESGGDVGSTANPRSQDVMVRNNRVTGQKWSSLDTHVGQRISFVNNQIRDCVGSAINAVYIDAGGNAANALLSPQDILIEGNTITYSSVQETDAAMNMAILLRGSISTDVTNRERASGVIRGNVIRRYGRQDVSTSGAIFLGCGTGIVVAGNVMTECRAIGVHVYDCLGTVINGNTFVDLWRSSGTVAAIYTNLALESGMDLTVTNNRYVRGPLVVGTDIPAGSVVNSHAITGTNSAAITVTEGGNVWGGASFASAHTRQTSGAGTGQRVVNGTAAPTSGTWERGDQVRNVTPAAGGYAGWICTTAGSPGAWRGFGSIAP